MILFLIEIDKVCIVIIASGALRAIVGKVSFLPTLKMGIVPSIPGRSRGYIDLSSIISPIWGLGSIHIHWDRLIIHPSWGICGVELLSSTSSLGLVLLLPLVSSRVKGLLGLIMLRVHIAIEHILLYSRIVIRRCFSEFSHDGIK